MKLPQKPLARSSALTMLLVFLSLGFSGLANAAVCDVDKDGDIDRLDLRLIAGARNKPASGPGDPRDADADGTITVPDMRICLRRCNLPSCKIIGPAPPPQTSTASKPDARKNTPVQKAVKDASKPAKSTSTQSGTVMQAGTIVSRAEWKVKSGDTLYAIGRAVYPGDSKKQAQLRQDIIKLNPAVFANGANNMTVGGVLKLPGYVVPKAAPSIAVEKPEPETRPVVAPVPKEEVGTEPETPREVAPVPKVEVEPDTDVQEEKGPSGVREPAAFSLFGEEGNFLISPGYSYGGDKLVYQGGSYDPAGASGHLRLGYESIYQNASGYRVALGLQYGMADRSGGTTTLSDTYLQLAYQYRANPYVYGIGVVLHQGATIDDVSTVEFDASNGLVAYLENTGKGVLAGWGISYTSLDIEEATTGESFDASRAELYYSWKF